MSIDSGHGLIVKPQYILDCYAHRSRLPLYSYILKPLVNDMNDDDEEEDAVEEEEANWEYLAFGCILEDPQAAIESDTERLLALLSSESFIELLYNIMLTVSVQQAPSRCQTFSKVSSFTLTPRHFQQM